MTFAVPADSYDRFMGRYSVPLAPLFAEAARVGVGSGQRVLDVGCGPGALTHELAGRVGDGGARVVAIDPSGSFVGAVHEREPGVGVCRGDAERLPFAGASFDAALAQLVVHFMRDPVGGLREMARVTRPGGVVAACVWDFGDGGGGPLSGFWDAVRALDPQAEGEAARAGARRGHLAQLFREAGLDDVDDGLISITVEHGGFDEWWEPFTLGVGPAGAYVASLDDAGRDRLREHCLARSPSPVVITAGAWVATGVTRCRR